MPRVAKSNKPADSTANLGFEATALRDSAPTSCEAFLQSLLRSREANAAKDNRWLAPHTAMRDRALRPSEAKPQSLPRQRDIRRAIIEADLVGTALRDTASHQSKVSPQALLRSREANKAKNNMVALPGQLFFRTQIPVCLWFLRENGNASAKCSGFMLTQISNRYTVGKIDSSLLLN